MKDNKNIILIGMPSSGKSTIGKQLSYMLGIEFIDTDSLIKNREGKELRDIVNTDGLEKFLSIQNEILMGLNARNSIIATGGSVIYNSAGMQHLKSIGIIVYLKLEFGEIEARITSERRFARGREQSFYDIYKERIPLYEKYSDVTIDCSNKSVEEIATEVMEAVGKIDY